jgi:hypothetical protein
LPPAPQLRKSEKNAYWDVWPAPAAGKREFWDKRIWYLVFWGIWSGWRKKVFGIWYLVVGGIWNGWRILINISAICDFFVY